MKKLILTICGVLALGCVTVSCGNGDQTLPEAKKHDAFPSWEQSEANSRDSCLKAGPQLDPECRQCDQCAPCDTATN